MKLLFVYISVLINRTLKPNHVLACIGVLAILFNVSTSGLLAQNNFPISSGWFVNGTVETTAFDAINNVVYVGGTFTYIGPDEGRGTAIDTNGTVLSEYLNPNGDVLVAVTDGAGGWYIGGSFTQVGGQTRNRLARINSDGTLHPWNPNANNAAAALLVDGDVVYIGGFFTSLGGETRNRIAAVDATTGALRPWNPSANGSVEGLALGNGVIYACGTFTNIGAQNRLYLAAIDAATGGVTTWNPSSNGRIRAITLSNGVLYAGGDFTSLGGQARSRLGAVNAETGVLITTWNPGVGSTGASVRALVASGGLVYVGGNFITVASQTRNGLAAINASDGTVTSWNPNVGGTSPLVSSMHILGDKLYVGGSFSSVGGQSRNNLAAINLSTGVATAWNLNPSRPVNAVSGSGALVYVGGEFTSVGGAFRNNIAALDAATGFATAWNPDANEAVNALFLSGSTLYVGGSFTNIGGQARNYIAALHTGTGIATAWNPNAGSSVYTLAGSSGLVYAGGAFSNIGGQQRNNLAALDASTGAATAWNPNAGDWVTALAVHEGVVYAGGFFQLMGNQTRRNIAAIDAATGNPTPWNPNPTYENSGEDTWVNALSVSGQVVYAGGIFDRIGDSTRNSLAALDIQTGKATAWDPNVPGFVRTIVLDGCAMYIGGDFDMVGDSLRNRLAALDATNGQLLPWNPEANGTVRTLSVGGGNIFAGGEFTAIGSQARGQFAAFELDEDKTAGPPSSLPTLCLNDTLTTITHTTTGATGIGTPTGLPNGVTAAWANGTISINGVPTTSGTFNYAIPLSGGCGSVHATGTITVSADMTAGAGSSMPTVCINTALTPITHATTGATGIGAATGLPEGVTASWATNTITLSGAPTASGTFAYAIPLTGGCGTVNATGSIAVTPDMTVTAASSTPSLCLNSVLRTITHTTTGATGIGAATGLPPGVTASWGNDTISIVGMPTAVGTFNYTIPLTGSCGSVSATGTITVTTADMMTGPASSTPALCINTELSAITHTTTNATGIGLPVGLPSGVVASWESNTITIGGTPSQAGTFNYTIPLMGGCGDVAATGTITVFADMVAGAASASPSLCVNTAMNAITHATTDATGIGTPEGLPAGVIANWENDQITISGTPTESGTFTYAVPLTGGCGIVNAVGTIEVIADMTAGPASAMPTICIDSLLTPITHMTTLVTGIGTGTGLPSGVVASWADDAISISGSPTESGTFNYAIPLNGGCGSVSATGTILVNPEMIAGPASASPTLCIHTVLETITHTTTDATGIGTPAGLPAGVTASWSGNLISIDGTPTESGTFNYSIPLEGGCGRVDATGTIIVSPDMVAGPASVTPSVCLTDAILPIAHKTTHATGIGTPTGLPTGVMASWVNDTLSIVGTPTEVGIFNYSIPLTGGCGMAAATGRIRATTENMVVGEASATPTLCVQTELSAITHATSVAEGIGTPTGLPAGVTASWANDAITISGIPTESGTFNYAIPLVGGCDVVQATGAITVLADMTAGAASSTPIICVETELTLITHATTLATGIGSPSGLPPGVTAIWEDDAIQISGAPTSIGTFAYTIPLTGGCGVVEAMGSIDVIDFVSLEETTSIPTTGTLVADGPITSTAYDPEKNVVYIGGFFRLIGPNQAFGAVVDTGGSVDANFAKPNGEVRYAVPDGAGGWYIGGNFTLVGDEVRNRLARLNSDGTLHPWNPNANDEVLSIVPIGDVVYVSGFFTSIGGQTRNHLAALDATTGAVKAWNPNANAVVRTIVPDGGVLYVGGFFSNVGGQARNRVAALDAETGVATSWNPGASSLVTTLAVHDGVVYMGGLFTSVGGQTRNRLAAVDAATGAVTAWDPNANDQVNVLAISNGIVYIAGTFRQIGGQERNRIAAIDLQTGLPTAWNPDADNEVRTLFVSGGLVYVGGRFSSIGGQPRSFIAALDATTAEAAPWNPAASLTVTFITVSDNRAYVGGLFAIIGGQVRNRLAALDGTTGALLPWNPNVNNRVAAIHIKGDLVYVGGEFTNIGGHTRNRLAALDANTGIPTSWNPDAKGPVFTIASSGNLVYVGGSFMNIGGQDRRFIAALDASTGAATPWNPDADNQVNTIVLSNGLLYAGGRFINIGGNMRERVAALDLTSGVSTSFNTSLEGEVYTMIVRDTIVYLGGGLVFVGGQRRNNLASVHATTGMVTSWNPNANALVNTLSLSGGVLYAAGRFTSLGGQTRNYLAAFNAKSGDLTSWNPNADNEAQTILASGNRVYAGGQFTIVGTQARSRFALFETSPADPPNFAGPASSAPALCVNDALEPIKHSTFGATGIGRPVGLPPGVSASWASDTITVSGLPTEVGTYNYAIPLTGGCGNANATGTIKVNPDMSVGLALGATSSCLDEGLTPINLVTVGATGIGTPTGLPSGVTATWANDTITISGSTEATGTYLYTIPLTGGCGQASATGSIEITTAIMTVEQASASPTLCIQTLLPDITHATTVATGIGTPTGLPAGVTAVWDADVITISGTPTVSGTFNYSIPLVGGCEMVSAMGTIEVTPDMTSGAASAAPVVCVDTELTPITHTTSRATGIGVPVGLPGGVTASWDNDVVTIIGAPTEAGVFHYDIPLIGGCGNISSSGTITVNAISNLTPENTAGAASSSPTLCLDDVLTPIKVPTTGATGIGIPMDLPTGVTAIWANDTIYISGSPAEAGIFDYSIPLTGGCGSVNATGSITVKPYMSSGPGSSTPTVCINTGLPAIKHATEGATGIGTATGLPSGVTATWANDTITISGSPTESGAFMYSIALTGGCGVGEATGTISVTTEMTIGAASLEPSLCAFLPLTPIIHTALFATGVDMVSGLPSGVTATLANDTLTISGTPTESGTFNYTVALKGCGSASAEGSIEVDLAPLVTASAILDPVYTINNGSASASYTGGLEPVELLWSTGNTEASLSNLAAGMYFITATGGNGCATTDSVILRSVIRGTVRWSADTTLGVKDVDMFLSGDVTNDLRTVADGSYAFPSIGSEMQFLIAPEKNTGLLNGITAADATRIQRHVVLIEELPGPYLLLAGDLNGSGSITNLDAIVLSQCLLNNPIACNRWVASWRFVDAAHVFGNPKSPWNFPDTIKLTPSTVRSGTGIDFIGIKVGDVVNADANPQQRPQPVVLSGADVLLQAGEIATLPLTVRGYTDIAAWQFALGFAPEVLSLEGVDLPEGGLLSPEDLGLWQADAGEMRCVRSALTGQSLEDGTTVLGIRFKAKQSGVWLSDVLWLTEEAIAAKAYTNDLSPQPILLELGRSTSASDVRSSALQLMAMPNPAHNHSLIRFNLPEAAEAHLRVLDMSGRLVQEHSGWFGSGTISHRIELPSVGVYVVELHTPQGFASIKLVSTRP